MSEVTYMRSFAVADTRAMELAQGIVDIPIQFHVVRKRDGSGGMTEEALRREVQQLNSLYIKANLRFVINEPIKSILDEDYAEFYLAQEEILCPKQDVEQVINIYGVNEIKGGYYGYTYHPDKSRKNRLIISQAGFDNHSTLAHELGHFFGLYHTHGKGGTLTERPEPIERNVDLDRNGKVDCYETGDDVCDTPADPNIGLATYSQYYSEDCEDAVKMPAPSGGYYEPQLTNLMSYNQYANCRTRFTDEQFARIAQTARRERSHLIRQTTSNERIELAGNVHFFLKDNQSMPLDLDVNLYRFTQPYRTGTTFTFTVQNQSEQAFYLSIVNMDSKGQVVKVFPYPQDRPIVTTGKKINPLNGFITLDNLPKMGMEYSCILVSLEALKADEIVAQMQQTKGTFTQRLYQVLGSRLLPLEQVNYVAGNTIVFNGKVKPNEVLPIMLEMKRE